MSAQTGGWVMTLVELREATRIVEEMTALAWTTAGEPVTLERLGDGSLVVRVRSSAGAPELAVVLEGDES